MDYFNYNDCVVVLNELGGAFDTIKEHISFSVAEAGVFIDDVYSGVTGGRKFDSDMYDSGKGVREISIKCIKTAINLVKYYGQAVSGVFDDEMLG